MKSMHTLTGGKKVFAVSVIVAVLLASLSAFSVFAAPATPAAPANASEAAERIFGNQASELSLDRTWFDNFKADHSNFVNVSKPNKLQQYLDQYAIALGNAEAIVKSRGTAVITGKSTNEQVNTLTRLDQTDQQDLAIWLHLMRDLRVKVSQIG
jgi:hypothetical protein